MPLLIREVLSNSQIEMSWFNLCYAFLTSFHMQSRTVAEAIFHLEIWEIMHHIFWSFPMNPCKEDSLWVYKVLWKGKTYPATCKNGKMSLFLDPRALRSAKFRWLLPPCLEKEMVTHSSILAWRIPWTEKPGRLQSTGSQRVRHDWATPLTHSLYLPVRPF